MKVARVRRSFFEGEPLEVGRSLIGMELGSDLSKSGCGGLIVETEVYMGPEDRASHAWKARRTARTEVLFGPRGYSYVFQIYGMHYCFNVVSSPEGVGEAVLIRALEPTEGIELMEKRRHTYVRRSLCSGPGKLVRAMGITRALNGTSLIDTYSASTRLYLLPATDTAFDIITTTRIGITQGADLPYRFYVKGSLYISRK